MYSIWDREPLFRVAFGGVRLTKSHNLQHSSAAAPWANGAVPCPQRLEKPPGTPQWQHWLGNMWGTCLPNHISTHRTTLKQLRILLQTLRPMIGKARKAVLCCTDIHGHCILVFTPNVWARHRRHTLILDAYEGSTEHEQSFKPDPIMTCGAFEAHISHNDNYMGELWLSQNTKF
jgi:hypothetical protein